jgi:hypothetical protein
VQKTTAWKEDDVPMAGSAAACADVRLCEAPQQEGDPVLSQNLFRTSESSFPSPDDVAAVAVAGREVGKAVSHGRRKRGGTIS